jgi:hypothetical protein
MLVEMDPRTVDRHADIDKVGYDRVSGAYAHRWVRDDRPHETPLFVDFDGRIRYARDAS